MKLLLRRWLGIGLRIVIAGACCLGIWNSWKFAYADNLAQRDTEESLRSAIRIVPDGWQYYMRLAQFDQVHARELLGTALRLNRYNAQADIELALQYESEGDFGPAERLLLDAFDVDHTYLPRWSLANYYLRRDNLQGFWAWARKAAEMPADDIRPLFELCWRVSPDPGVVAGAVLTDKPDLIRQYLAFLLAKDQLRAAAQVAPRLIRAGLQDSDRSLLFAVINRMVAANDGADADTLWHLLIEQQWVGADITTPNNASFEREPLPVSFDWSLPEYPGLHSWPGPSGLETEFTGSQPEDCTIAEQAVVLKPGNYKMDYAYHTSDIPTETGIRWEIIDANSNTVIVNSPDLSSDALKNSTLAFTVPPEGSILRLRLAYQRSLGTPRISGMLVLRSIRVQPAPK